MTCRTCETNPLFCTAVTERNSKGDVISCKEYKPYQRTVTIGLWHMVFIAISFIFYSFMVGLFAGHEMTWETAEQQQIRNLQTMFKDGLNGGRTFTLPANWSIETKFYPRRDGGVNVK